MVSILKFSQQALTILSKEDSRASTRSSRPKNWQKGNLNTLRRNSKAMLHLLTLQPETLTQSDLATVQSFRNKKKIQPSLQEDKDWSVMTTESKMEKASECT